MSDQRPALLLELTDTGRRWIFCFQVAVMATCLAAVLLWEGAHWLATVAYLGLAVVAWLARKGPAWQACFSEGRLTLLRNGVPREHFDLSDVTEVVPGQPVSIEEQGEPVTRLRSPALLLLTRGGRVLSVECTPFQLVQLLARLEQARERDEFCGQWPSVAKVLGGGSTFVARSPSDSALAIGAALGILVGTAMLLCSGLAWILAD